MGTGTLAPLLSLLPFGQSQSGYVDSGFGDKHAARAPVSFSSGSIARSSRRAGLKLPRVLIGSTMIFNFFLKWGEAKGYAAAHSLLISLFFRIRPLLNHPSESDMCVLTRIRASARGDCSRLRTSYLRPHGRAMRCSMPYLSCVCRTIGLTDKADRPLILRSVEIT